MDKFTLKFNTQLYSLNAYIDVQRINHNAGHQLKKRLTNAIRVETMSQTRTAMPVQLYDMELTWIRKDKREDADNIYFGIKFILDGIVSAKILKGDGRSHIRNISHRIDQGTKNYVIVKFLPVEIVEPHQKQHVCSYSKAMNEPRPRICVVCGKRETFECREFGGPCLETNCDDKCERYRMHP